MQHGVKRDGPGAKCIRPAPNRTVTPLQRHRTRLGHDSEPSLPYRVHARAIPFLRSISLTILSILNNWPVNWQFGERQ